MKQSGQTLIETVVGVALLTTGLIAGLALAIYTFTASRVSGRSDVASGLAREGIEGVRRLRDSNWLAGSLSDCGGGQVCYAAWLTTPYNITGAAGSGLEYRLIFNPSSNGNKWTLDSNTDYRLYTQASGVYTHTANSTPSPFYRKVAVVYSNTAAPYSATSPLVLVRSTVWWNDKRCPTVTDPNLTRCKIISEEYMTNWKNY